MNTSIYELRDMHIQNVSYWVNNNRTLRLLYSNSTSTSPAILRTLSKIEESFMFFTGNSTILLSPFDILDDLGYGS